MEIFRFLKPKQKKKFVSEADYKANLESQSHIAITKLGRLREFGIEEEDELGVDYFFYTDSVDKGSKLIEDLKKMNHLIQPEITMDKYVIIKGKTTPMKMMHEVLRDWAIDMCELGIKHDCAFSNWEINQMME